MSLAFMIVILELSYFVTVCRALQNDSNIVLYISSSFCSACVTTNRKGNPEPRIFGIWPHLTQWLTWKYDGRLKHWLLFLGHPTYLSADLGFTAILLSSFFFIFARYHRQFPGVGAKFPGGLWWVLAPAPNAGSRTIFLKIEPASGTYYIPRYKIITKYPLKCAYFEWLYNLTQLLIRVLIFAYLQSWSCFQWQWLVTSARLI